MIAHFEPLCPQAGIFIAEKESDVAGAFDVSQSLGSFVEDRRYQFDAVLTLQSSQSRTKVIAGGDDRYVQRVAHRNSQRSSAERVAAAGAQQQGRRSETSRDADDAANVFRILDAAANDEQMTTVDLHQVVKARRRLSQTATEHPCVKRLPHQHLSQAVWQDKRWYVLTKMRSQQFDVFIAGQNGSNVEIALQQLNRELLTFGNELRGPAGQIGFLEVTIDVQSRIVEV